MPIVFVISLPADGLTSVTWLRFRRQSMAATSRIFRRSTQGLHRKPWPAQRKNTTNGRGRRWASERLWCLRQSMHWRRRGMSSHFCSRGK